MGKLKWIVFFICIAPQLLVALEETCDESDPCVTPHVDCVDGKCQCISGYIADNDECLKVATEYENSCTIDAQCIQFLRDGAICTQNKCVCSDSYHYLHGRCHKTVGPSGQCGNSDECYEGSEFQASSCNNGICKCSDGFYQRGRTTCRRQVKNVGDKCLLDYDCDVKNGTCVLNQCQSDSELFNAKRSKKVRSSVTDDVRISIGGLCTTNTDCEPIGNSICDVDGYCICDRAHFASEDTSSCIPEIGEACESSDTLKVDQAVCKENIWTCPIDRIATKNNRECRELTETISGACTTAADCRLFGPNAECVLNACQCNMFDEYDESKSYCWNSDNDGPELGTYCKKENDCKTQDSVCKNNECSCKDYHLNEDGECLKQLKADCQETNECRYSNSECLKGQCQCTSGWVSDSDSTQCIRVATGYEDSCENEAQCSSLLGSGGTCENNKCVCKDLYHYLHGQCHLSKRPSENCEKSDECYEGSEYQASSCNEGTCKCSDGFYLRGRTTCRRHVKNVGDECLIDNDCDFKNGICVSNQCEIGTRANVKTDKLVKRFSKREARIEIGAACDSAEECNSIGNSICGVDKKCICNKAHFPTDDNTGCVPEIGEACDSSADSLHVEHAVCREKMWTCPIDRIVTKNNRECKELTQTIDGACNAVEDCRLFGPSAECSLNTCKCGLLDEYVESKSYCWNSEKDGLELGTYCKKENDCFTKNSICKNSECSCKEYHLDEDGQCLKQLKADCENSDECIISNSQCEKNKCTCEKYHFELKGQCLKGLNANCQNKDDCKADNTECQVSEEICKCKKDTVGVPDNSCLPISQYQKECKYDVQCTTALANTFCKNGTKGGQCECLANHHYKNKKCFINRVVEDKCNESDECVTEHSHCNNGKCECLADYPNFYDNKCNLSSMARPFFSFVVFAFLASKLLS